MCHGGVKYPISRTLAHRKTPKGFNSKAQGCVLATLGVSMRHQYGTPKGNAVNYFMRPLTGVA
jgi:hypothetical protein